MRTLMKRVTSAQHMPRPRVKKSTKGVVDIRLALIVIDVQNCFMAHGGAFDRMAFDIRPYRSIIDPLNRTIKQAAALNVPVFFTKAIREKSGLDLLSRVHRILPKSRRERIRRIPLAVKGTWDSDIIQEVEVDSARDHVLEKRRDSAFLGTELDVWLKALGVDALVFSGVDTAICVESTIRDAFDRGYDIIVLSDTTASRSPRFYQHSLEVTDENFGVVLTSDEFFARVHRNKSGFTFALPEYDNYL